jgi:hypothetical protein
MPVTTHHHFLRIIAGVLLIVLPGRARNLRDNFGSAH